jgi:hypothetical protein
MSALFSGVRRKIKEGNYKNIQVRFTPIFFEATHKIVPKNQLSRPMYKVKNYYTNKELKKKIYSNELQQLVHKKPPDKISVEEQSTVMKRAHKLNGTNDVYENDVILI